MRSSAVAVSFAAALSLAPSGWSVARADGTSCQSRVDLAGLVEQSRSILLVEVLAAEHQYAEREAYGEKHRYLAEYRFQAKVVRAVRGKAPPAGERISVRMRGGAIPGRWVVVRVCYPRKVGLEKVAPGTQLLAFTGEEPFQGPPDAAQEPVHVEELEDAKVLPEVEQALRRAPR